MEQDTQTYPITPLNMTFWIIVLYPGVSGVMAVFGSVNIKNTVKDQFRISSANYSPPVVCNKNKMIPMIDDDIFIIFIFITVTITQQGWTQKPLIISTRRAFLPEVSSKPPSSGSTRCTTQTRVPTPGASGAGCAIFLH